MGCREFTAQTYINFSGYENNDLPEKYDKTNIGRFNIPIYYVSTRGGVDQPAHAINAVLTGDNPLNWNDWYFVEPQTDNNMTLENGNWTFPNHNYVEVGILNGLREYASSIIPVVNFYIDNNRQVSVSESNKKLVLQRPTPTSVAEQNLTRFSLSQNYPNPFNNSTAIEYNLEKPGKVSLDVLNTTGQKLETLVNGNQTAGSHRININLKNQASGTYFCRLRIGDNVETRKMILVK